MGFLDWLARLLKLPARRQLVGNSSSDPRLTQSPEALCEAIDKAEARAADLARAYAAQLNDRQSFQARLMREQERAIDMARGKVTRELLDISDEIDRALGAAQGDESPLAQGIRLIHADLQKRLQSLGTKRLQLVGTRFDPNLAEAVEVVPVAQVGEDEMVLEEVRPGFTLGDQVVRPARVRVGRYCAPIEPEAPADKSAPEENPAEAAPRAENDSAADASAEPVDAQSVESAAIEAGAESAPEAAIGENSAASPEMSAKDALSPVAAVEDAGTSAETTGGQAEGASGVASAAVAESAAPTA
ncbi:MAG: nucleotide exchange factor GrpE [Myxococcaceae bacterium]|nr:nucleotide exchange factor GrpE [Myxococcaceae bacterium]